MEGYEMPLDPAILSSLQSDMANYLPTPAGGTTPPSASSAGPSVPTSVNAHHHPAPAVSAPPVQQQQQQQQQQQAYGFPDWFSDATTSHQHVQTGVTTGQSPATTNGNLPSSNLSQWFQAQPDQRAPSAFDGHDQQHYQSRAPLAQAAPSNRGSSLHDLLNVNNDQRAGSSSNAPAASHQQPAMSPHGDKLPQQNHARQSSNQHDEAASVPEAALHLLRLALPPAGGEQSDQHGTNMNGTDSAMDFAGSRLAHYNQSQHQSQSQFSGANTPTSYHAARLPMQLPPIDTNVDSMTSALQNYDARTGSSAGSHSAGHPNSAQADAYYHRSPVGPRSGTDTPQGRYEPFSAEDPRGLKRTAEEALGGSASRRKNKGKAVDGSPSAPPAAKRAPRRPRNSTSSNTSTAGGSSTSTPRPPRRVIPPPDVPDRAFPSHVEKDRAFPRLYRRFPVPSAFAPESSLHATRLMTTPASRPDLQLSASSIPPLPFSHRNSLLDGPTSDQQPLMLSSGPSDMPSAYGSQPLDLPLHPTLPPPKFNTGSSLTPGTSSELYGLPTPINTSVSSDTSEGPHSSGAYSGDPSSAETTLSTAPSMYAGNGGESAQGLSSSSLMPSMGHPRGASAFGFDGQQYASSVPVESPVQSGAGAPTSASTPATTNVTFLDLPAGASWNKLCDPLNLYAARFIRGKADDKAGACPICYEARERGGEGHEVWLKLKNSSFVYHMSYSHGLSNVTGLPFSPPLKTRERPCAKQSKDSRALMTEGLCHKCDGWIPMLSTKNVDAQIPELIWWKHAKSCHGDNTIEGEGDYYIQDDIYRLVLASKQNEGSSSSVAGPSGTGRSAGRASGAGHQVAQNNATASTSTVSSSFVL